MEHDNQVPHVLCPLLNEPAESPVGRSHSPGSSLQGLCFCSKGRRVQASCQHLGCVGLGGGIATASLPSCTLSCVRAPRCLLVVKRPGDECRITLFPGRGEGADQVYNGREVPRYSGQLAAAPP